MVDIAVPPTSLLDLFLRQQTHGEAGVRCEASPTNSPPDLQTLGKPRLTPLSTRTPPTLHASADMTLYGMHLAHVAASLSAASND